MSIDGYERVIHLVITLYPTPPLTFVCNSLMANIGLESPVDLIYIYPFVHILLQLALGENLHRFLVLSRDDHC